MGEIRYIDKDFVTFKLDPDGERKELLVFGDKVEVLGEVDGGKRTRIRALELWDGTVTGTVTKAPFRTRDKGVMRVSMVDVQQGDGMIIETPPDDNDETKIVFVDGGDNKLFARHAAARFRHRGSSDGEPLAVDLMLVTHGDADHFEGLNHIRNSEEEARESVRLFIHPKRIYHNGLIKGPSSLKNAMFGKTVEHGGVPAIVDLYDDPTDDAAAKNTKFKPWAATIDKWRERGDIETRRVAFGMDEDDLFGFLGDVEVEIQGPFPIKVVDPDDGEEKDALPFLHSPPSSVLVHLEDDTDADKSLSASHTINGHSIALRLTYGNVRFSLTGDLNQESMHEMRKHLAPEQLEAEIVKAPHHGSHEFDLDVLRDMRPVVTLISSGDESARKEHIHPRATLVNAAGSVSRGDTGLVLCTELAAFFALKKYSHTRQELADFFEAEADDPKFLDVEDGKVAVEDLADFFDRGVHERDWSERTALPHFFGFERTNFGIVHVRTDGERVLVFTYAGKDGMTERYAFEVDDDHDVEFKNVRRG